MIQVVKRAFDVLEFLALDPDGNNRLTDVAAATELNASTCVRILKTLTTLGYVGRHSEKGGYSLGPRAYSIASQGPYRKNLVLAGRDLMTELAGSIKESVLMASLYHGKRTVLYEVEADRKIKAQTEADYMYDNENPLRTATGRLLLSHLSLDDCDRIISDIKNYANFWPVIRKRGQLGEALREIHDQDFAVRKGESEVVGLAVPIKENGIVTASLGVYLPAFRFTKAREEKILQEMRVTVEKIEKVLAGKR
jgi:IclR family transcriptional regulator, KDG regulon repressor